MGAPEQGMPDWHDRAQWKQEVWSKWMEPLVIVIVLLSAMYTTRRKNYSILTGPRNESNRALLSPDSRRSSDEWDPTPSAGGSQDYPRKTRRVFGVWTVRTPNSSRFARNFHSKILAKFPFLIEMFYWVLAVILYRLTLYMTGIFYGGSQGLWNLAQRHGQSILEFEATLGGSGGITGSARYIEWRIQQWFLTGAAAGDWRGSAIHILNRVYALIHIPGTAAFIAYYYATAPTHRRFCIVRRSMSLANFVAFFVFTIYPCMPPRLLPKEYGFVDTVEAEDATSVWQKGDYVNALAAMPSMHFGYAFAIGSVLVYESGFLRRLHLPKNMDAELEAVELMKEKDGDVPRPAHSRIALLTIGIAYPSLILLAIISTANHYFLDAVAGAIVVTISFACNRFLLNFLPLEDWLLWALRLEKPEPTTGVRQDTKEARL
ncbi:integral membrane protein [Xylariomycetidae sp. FL0641]|nr:integral membrane protein [Xylariomycetidae sp. FL0641]